MGFPGNPFASTIVRIGFVPALAHEIPPSHPTSLSYTPGRCDERTDALAKETLTISIDPDSELARALAEAEAPVVLDSAGVRYTVEREDIFANYDPRAALRALRRSRGMFQGIDTESLLADLAEQRSQAPTRPF